MIRITKPARPPAVLTDRGAPVTEEHGRAFDACPDEYRTGTRTFEHQSSIYAAPDVKETLRAAQHDKCAFCESRFSHVGYGDVEHFRPKGAYRQKAADPLKYPGYYWLAYDWANLFYSCQLCNQQFKRNRFPLRDGRKRARSHRADVTREEPLLIDPAAREPAAFLAFRGEYVYAVGECTEGRATIDVLGLNRPDLVENRLQRKQDLENLLRLCALLRDRVHRDHRPDDIADLKRCEAMLTARTADDSEYAAMARARLSSMS